MIGRYAIYSIGTNSTRVLVADHDESGAWRVCRAGSIGTRIGRALRDRGSLEPQAEEATYAALVEHAAMVASLHVTASYLIATSALRRAAGAQAFAARCSALVGAAMEILDGAAEARYSFLGASALCVSPDEGEIAVADVGGGSTEYAVGRPGNPQWLASCEIGAVRLTEAVAGLSGVVTPEQLASAQERIRTALASLRQAPKASRLLLVGGSATSTIALLRGASRPFVCAALRRSDLQRSCRELLELPLERRRELPGMNPQRADILAAGQLLLEGLYDIAGVESATVSTADLLLGYLASHVERPQTPLG